MPATSAKQKKFMDAAAHNPAFAKKVGVPVKVAKEYSQASKGKTFRQGGEMKESKAMVKKEVEFMKKKGAPKSMIKHEMAEAKIKKFGTGGLPVGSPEMGGGFKSAPTMPGKPTVSGFPDKGAPPMPASTRPMPASTRPMPETRPTPMPETRPTPMPASTRPMPASTRPMPATRPTPMPASTRPMPATKPTVSGVPATRPTPMPAVAVGPVRMARGGGIEKKGKTKGKMVKMARGGGIEIRGKTKGKMLARGGKTC